MSDASPITFLYSNSYDLSLDLLIRRLGTEQVFRFNLDLWRDYSLQIEARRFSIADPTGRSVSCDRIAKFLWRKPLTTQQLFPDRAVPREQIYQEEELAYAMRDVWNRLYLDGRAVLIDPVSDVLAGKLVQARIALRYFPVPSWRFVAGRSPGSTGIPPSVVKSLTSSRVGNRAILYTTRVSAEQLAPDAPWMIQDCVDASRDVTVVVVRDALFAFELERGGFPSGVVDWRQARTMTPEQSWKPHRLSPATASSIRQFMEAMSLHYGRLDFLLSGETYHFLEVNPNGEWGWLDPRGEAGILDALAEELSPKTPCHPLPNPRVIRA
jgi:hypothetical protein